MAELTYRRLLAAVTALGKEVTRDRDTISAIAGDLDADASDTARIAELIATMGVDTASVSEARDLARDATHLGEAARGYAAAGDTTARAAQAAHDQARASHGGINDAYARAQVDISNLKPEWLTQE